MKGRAEWSLTPQQTCLSMAVKTSALVVLVAALALLGRAEDAQPGRVPIVLWHGMGDSCYNMRSMGYIQKALQSHLDGVYVKSLCFGSDQTEDAASGFLLNANKQVEMACQDIASDPELQNGYHAIGYSQGGQFLRAVSQRCPSPPMKVLVSFGGQHQGVYGLPRCGFNFICDYVRRLLSFGAYWGWVQDRLVQAQYWHDPRHPDSYAEKSTFLADINNEREPRNASYATNLAKLERLVLVKFNQDTMVKPVESQWFEFYEPGSVDKIQALEDSAIYKEDRIGLRQLAESGRLERLALDGDHLRIPMQWFFTNIVDKYLKN